MICNKIQKLVTLVTRQILKKKGVTVTKIKGEKNVLQEFFRNSVTKNLLRYSPVTTFL